MGRPRKDKSVCYTFKDQRCIHEGQREPCPPDRHCSECVVHQRAYLRNHEPRSFIAAVDVFTTSLKGK